MNLIKAAELLKGAPDSELTQYLQNPNGDFPEYLVASEIKRRETMREKYAAANQGQPTKTSIIEELLQKDNQQMRQQQMPQQMPPEAMGLGAVPPPEGMQLTPSPMMEAAQQQPQQFYDGGAVSFAHGGLAGLSGEIHDYLQGYAQGGLAGEIHDYLQGYAIGGAVDPYKLPDWVTQQQQLPESMTREQAFNMAEQQMGPSAFEGADKTIGERQKRLEENRKNYLSDFLINTGLGMTMSKGNLLQAAAEGASRGFDYHQKAKAADEEAQRQIEDSKFKIKAGQRAEKAGLIGLSNQFYTSAEAAKDRAIDNNRQAAFLGLQSAQARDTAGYHARMADASMAQVAKAAEANRLTAQYRQDALEAQKADRLENRKIKALEIRTKLMKARNDFQNDVINNPMSDYAQKVKALSKQYTGYALERAKADLLKSARNSYGLDDLEAALTDYQK
jgi:hypothetical protein